MKGRFGIDAIVEWRAKTMQDYRQALLVLLPLERHLSLEETAEILGFTVPVLFQDEARFGRICRGRRCRCKKPWPPLVKAMLTHQYT